MRAAMEAALNEGQDISAAELDGNSNMWADRKKSESQSSYDAEVEAERWYIFNGLRFSGNSSCTRVWFNGGRRYYCSGFQGKRVKRRALNVLTSLDSTNSRVCRFPPN
jgi:hypothetical protein